MHTCATSSKNVSNFLKTITELVPVRLDCEDSTYSKIDGICAIGDIHGDIEAAMECFALCPCITTRKIGEGKWTVRWGNKNKKSNITYAVVQCGDIVDRLRSGNGGKDTEIEAEEEMILFACAMLSIQADFHKEGAFVRLIGNHELMNISGNLQGATEKSKAYYEMRCGGRERYFERGGEGAKRLCCYFGTRVVLRLGNFIFMHAGVSNTHVHEITKKTRGFLADGSARSLAEHVNTTVHGFASGKVTAESLEHVQIYLWDRTQGSHQHLPGEAVQEMLKSFIAPSPPQFNEESPLNLVIGHCPTPGITSVCEFEGKCRVHRIDVAMSRAFDNDLARCSEQCSVTRRPQILHVSNKYIGDVEVLLSSKCLARHNCAM